MADTGCQSCLAGVNILHPLGLTEDDLIPITMKMHAANNNRITTLGATALQFSGKSETDETINTRQIVDISMLLSVNTKDFYILLIYRHQIVHMELLRKNFPGAHISLFQT